MKKILLSVSLVLGSLASSAWAGAWADGGGLPWERELLGIELVTVQEKGRDEIAAIMGHSFLRLVDKGPVEEQWTIGFGGDLIGEDGVPEAVDVTRGLAIRKPYGLTLELRHLKEVSDRYALKQNRAMKRFIIPTTIADRERFQQLLREEAEKAESGDLGVYKFLTRNCTTEIARLLYTTFNVEPKLWFRKERRQLTAPFVMPKQFEKHGMALPRAGVVSAEEVRLLPYEYSWKPFDALYTRCVPGAAECVERWVAEAYDRLGEGWVKDVFRVLKKEGFSDRFSPDFVQRMREEYAVIGARE